MRKGVPMRTLTITLVAAFVFLLAQQLTAASPGFDQEQSGASQVVVSGTVSCWLDGGLSRVGFGVEAGIGVGLGEIGSVGGFATARNQSEECSDLVTRLAEEVPDHICEIGDTPHHAVADFGFVCTGRADAVISTVGKIARAVIRLGQP
jgi:hypothetical protein